MTTELTPAMRRSALISILRDPSLWPPGFEWDFGNCGDCAMGLAERLLGANAATSWAVGSLLGISLDDARNLFVPIRWGNTRNKFNYASNEITPTMVADRLEALHNSMKAD